MAEYMSAITVVDGRVTKKAQFLMGRGQMARLMVEVDHLFPFEKIMNETPREFYGPESHLKYAQAWSMVHFFYEAQGGRHRALIERYFKELLTSRTPRQAYEASFAPKTAELEREWKDYVRRLRP